VWCARELVGNEPFALLLPDVLVQHPRGCLAQMIDAALLEVGLEPSARERYPHEFSGGQRQRIAIARALIMEPKILLLDEPTSALDLSVQAEILNLLRRVGRNRGLTMLMVSHDLPVIAHMCSRIAVMKRGEIVETLPVDRLRRGEADHAYTRELLASSLETTMAKAN
jgi:peptide/nickel transport system ATP-binding protein